MPASYPTSAKTFTTKNTGDIIQSVDVDDLQDEVTAIEQTLITGPITLAALTAGSVIVTGASSLASLHVTGGSTFAGSFTSSNSTVNNLSITGGSTAASVSVTGGSTLGTLQVGGASTFAGAMNLTSGQIAFPAAQSASAGANTLDDYEEGTWTPVIGGSGGTSGQTYSAQVGSYIKIGKLVFLQCYAILTGKGTITTSVQIQGLPFASENTANQYAICPVWWTNLGTTWATIVGQIAPGGSVIGIVGQTVASAASNTPLTTADIGNTTQFMLTLTYRASA